MNYGASVLLGMLSPLLIFAFLLGWIVPLIMGIVRLRSRRRGIVLLVVGSVWALSAAAVIVLGVCAIFSVICDHATETQVFNASSWTGQTGRIELPWDTDARLSLRPVAGKGAPLMLAATNRFLVVPCGEYHVTWIQVSRKDQSGALWMLYGSIPPKSCSLHVEPDATVRLTCASGLRAWIDLHEARGNASMDVQVKDDSGNRFSLYSSGDRSKPRFEVVDSAGDVLWTGSFEFG